MPATGSLSGVVSTTTSVSQVQSDTVGASTRGVTVGANYQLNSTSGPLADQVWVSTRSLAVGSSETLDLLSLTDTIQGATGVQTMRQVRLVRVVNNETTTGPRIVVGPSGTNGWGRVAGEVGPGGELLAIQQTHAWGVTTGERAVTFRATGPTGSVSYSIVVAGTAATGPTGY
jgi:hypothetical protein